ncbi:hypothetical protein ABT218_15890 [Streptomyces sp. NPDC001455]|uniref:hypothetical protein n=1 Tax=Streptomyces sp. NPDC001455 TaxID=3154518 RepID=UPI00332BD9D5
MGRAVASAETKVAGALTSLRRRRAACSWFQASVSRRTAPVVPVTDRYSSWCSENSRSASAEDVRAA